jgi:hypothetical protein
MASMSDITATPLGHTDFTLSTVTPAPHQQQRRLQQLQQQQRVRQLYDSTPSHDGAGDSSSGVTAEHRQQQHEQDEFNSVMQVSAA